MIEGRDFEAWEYGEGGGFARTRLEFVPEPDAGWSLRRNGVDWMTLGPGYRLLDVECCGICSTDLGRRFLPFPLPQVIGHEVVLGARGRRYVSEINASCRARGLDDVCAFCRVGLDAHCPERAVLGIDRLPGGFGAAVLAPREALIEVPESLPSVTAVLVEPFAAALHAVTTVAPRRGDRVAVLGPRRLGMLVVAALAAWRRREDLDFEIIAAPRRGALADLALTMGADRVVTAPAPGPLADVVIDTTGAPEALELAVTLARRELHLKSTHGRAAAGLRHLTEFVVDELRLEPAEDLERVSEGEEPRPAVEVDLDLAEPAAAARRRVAAMESDAANPLGRADLVFASTGAAVDAAIRPDPGRAIALVRPRGRILVRRRIDAGSLLLAAVAERGLRVSSSRCGDFRSALALLDEDADSRALGERFVTHRFSRDRLPEAFRVAAGPDCIKAVVDP